MIMEENNNTTTMKKCRACGEEKPITEFYKNNHYKDGYYGVCKKCHNVQTSRNAEKRAALSKIESKHHEELAGFTPRQLMEELKYRGYKGTIQFTQEITL